MKSIGYVRIQGGLGNQLFQFFYGLHLTRIGTFPEVVYDLSFYTSGSQAGGSNQLRDLAIAEIFPAAKYTYRPPLVRVLRRIERRVSQSQLFGWEVPPKTGKVVHSSKYLEGFWQDWRVVDEGKEVWRELDFVPLLRADPVLPKISTGESVGVHVRRGDYLAGKNRTVYSALSQDYYQSSLNYIRSKLVKPRFFIFGDDFEYLRANFVAADCEVVNPRQGRLAFLDFLLLSKCRHYINANSTFSLVASVLGRGASSIVVSPPVWFIGTGDRPDDGFGEILR